MTVQCKYCGKSFATVRDLTRGLCMRHPDGVNKGRHAPYEGSAKDSYTCKYCGRTFRTIDDLTRALYTKHPDGINKGRHSPML